MSKKSKRPPRATRDVHSLIQEQAATLRHSGPHGVRDADTLPEVAALLEAARKAIGAAVPSTFVFEGRIYWLRVCLAAQINVFDGPAKASPLVQCLSLNSDDFGHTPGH